jgi:cathepsin F
MLNHILLLVAFILPLCSTIDDPTLYTKFQQYILQFNKTYPTIEEYTYRFNQFARNCRELENIKSLTPAGDTTQIMTANDTLIFDITDFFDLSEDEFENKFLTTIVTDEDTTSSQTPTEHTYVKGNETEHDKLRVLQDLPERFDWRDIGALTPVKQQHQCGACYAFSAVANLESQYFLKYGELLNLSEQQILNCNPYAIGCRGGNVAYAFKYLQKTPGLGLETSLRYIARQETCSYVDPVVKITGIKYAGTRDETYIASFLMKHGPLSIAINASLFKYYSKGILDYPDKYCDSRKLNHAVNIVGFGESNGVKYWVVRNTWGPHWGEEGYIRIAWGKCGVNTFVMTGIIE